MERMASASKALSALQAQSMHGDRNSVKDTDLLGYTRATGIMHTNKFIMIPKRRKYYIIIRVPMQNCGPHLVMVASALSLAHTHTWPKMTTRSNNHSLPSGNKKLLTPLSGRHYFALISLQFPGATTLATVSRTPITLAHTHSDGQRIPPMPHIACMALQIFP